MNALQVNKHHKELNAMRGNSYIYMGRTVQVEYWHEDDSNIHIVVESGRNIIIPVQKIKTELSNFLPADSDSAGESAVMLSRDAERMETLEDALMNSIKDIQDNKENAIAKAKQISGTTQTLLNITKTKIAMIKEIRKS